MKVFVAFTILLIFIVSNAAGRQVNRNNGGDKIFEQRYTARELLQALLENELNERSHGSDYSYAGGHSFDFSGFQGGNQFHSMPDMSQFSSAMETLQFSFPSSGNWDFSFPSSGNWDFSFPSSGNWAFSNRGFGPSSFTSGGFRVPSLTSGGFDLSSLNNAGFDLSSLTSGGYDLSSLNNAGYDLSSLNNAGYDLSSLNNAGFDLPSLTSGGFGLSSHKRRGNFQNIRQYLIRRDGNANRRRY